MSAVRDRFKLVVEGWRLPVGILVGAAALLLAPAFALAHLERPSYWPDPAPDASVSPAAGGEVPKKRSLGSAARNKGPGDVRIVCKGRNGKTSMFLAKKGIRRAKKRGFRVRPSVARTKLSKKEARKYRRWNKKFAKRCEYKSIQDAIEDSGNNDRVVIMPGRYTEPESRRAPVNDPRCAELTQLDTSGRETPSFAYQATCPHDQNLVYVQGRAIGDTPPPEPPLDDRHGIPDLGECLRCNLQVEGSSPRPVDVVIDAAKRGKKKNPAAKPGPPMKDVVFRADRADGIVVANMVLKGAAEHGFYTEETDGYRVDTVKMFWNLDYGNLSFTADHGLFVDCDGFGAGDAVLYPGASPETGEQADQAFYPDAPRINTKIKKCDMRGSALGYSGSMGNAVRITKSDIYGNGVGISSDTISASGHPGFPSDSMVIDNNNIFSNNLNLYEGDHGLEPRVGVPVGTGILWPGMNNGQVRDNYIFDNWRFGAMLFAIPDALVTPENEVEPGMSCPTGTPVEDPEDNSGQSTSCGNEFYGNHMGRAPKDWEPPAGFQNPVRQPQHSGDDHEGALVLPNGLDFWWDEMPVNVENCWYDNSGVDGTEGSVDSDPPVGPAEGVNEPGTLPDDCPTSVGNAAVYPAKAGTLIECSTWSRGDQAEDFQVCDWFETPPEPGKDDEFEPESAEAAAFEPTGNAKRLKRRMEKAFAGVEVGAWSSRP